MVNGAFRSGGGQVSTSVKVARLVLARRFEIGTNGLSSLYSTGIANIYRHQSIGRRVQTRRRHINGT
jgi:hypothetical protein